MKLKLYEIGDRYSFSIDDFYSNNHFYLTANIKSSYKYAWQAYSAARKLAMATPSHIDVINKYAAQDLTKENPIDISAEEMLHQHYDSIYQMIEERTEGEQKEEEREIIYEEIKVIVEEILKIEEQVEDNKEKENLKEVIGKFKKLVRSKFSKNLQKDVEEQKKMDDIIGTPPQNEQIDQEQQYDPSIPDKEVSKTANRYNNQFRQAKKDIDFNVIEEYAKKICKAIENKHPSSIYRLSKDNSITIMDSKDNSSLLKIQLDNELNINSIYPLENISDIYPLHSKEFYQRYWKPIVSSIGHYKINDCFVSENLPDIPEGKKDYIISSSNQKLILKFSTNIWELKATPIDAAKESKIGPKKPSEYTEDDFKEDTIVECIIPELASIFGKKGLVIQVIPLSSHIELDIQFFEKERGIKRLTTDQIKIANV